MTAKTVGHNSVQIPHNGKLTEEVWRKAERNQLRRERFRLVRKGVIVPAFRMKPQMMVKEGGRWVPQLGGRVPFFNCQKEAFK